MGAAVNKRVFTRDFKLSVARQLVGGHKRISQVCREHSASTACANRLCESVVRRWKMQYESGGEDAWTQSAKHSAALTVQAFCCPYCYWTVTGAGTLDEQALLTNRVKEREAALGRAHLEIERSSS